jgi:hypothetical protein
MPDTVTIPDDYELRLGRVMDETERLLRDPNASELSERLADVLSSYNEVSVTADQSFVGEEISEEDDPFALGGARDRLFWTFVGDVAVFRCVGLYDMWCAAQQTDLPSGHEDEIEELRAFLASDLQELREQVSASVMPRVRGGQGALVVEDSAKDKMRKISDDSTSNVLGAMFGALGGLIPNKTPGTVVRGIHRVVRGLHLGALLNRVEDLLNLAIGKLNKIFGPNLDPVLAQVRAWLDDVLKIKERVADWMFQTGDLANQIEQRLSTGGCDEKTSLDGLEHVYQRFESWSLGIQITNEGLRWGRRISSVAPAVRVALEGLRFALAGGAFLVGHYNLDSPTLPFPLPWRSRGLLSAIG